MGLLKLIKKIGEKNILVQPVTTAINRAAMRKSGICVLTLYTRAITVDDLLLSRGNVGVILWIPRELLTKATLSEVTSP